jgi:hypothetical protein
MSVQVSFEANTAGGGILALLLAWSLKIVFCPATADAAFTTVSNEAVARKKSVCVEESIESREKMVSLEKERETQTGS